MLAVNLNAGHTMALIHAITRATPVQMGQLARARRHRYNLAVVRRRRRSKRGAKPNAFVKCVGLNTLCCAQVAAHVINEEVSRRTCAKGHALKYQVGRCIQPTGRIQWWITTRTGFQSQTFDFGCAITCHRPVIRTRATAAQRETSRPRARGT